MSKLVVDSSIALKWFLPEADSPVARQILEDYQTGKIVLYAPDLIYAEFANVLWKRHRFQGLLIEDAETVLQAFGQLSITTTPSESLIHVALKLATRHERTVYDMLYVALALNEACPFVTADHKLFNALSPNFKVMTAEAWASLER
jgi:predicted nucleic acid-binding protein